MTRATADGRAARAAGAGDTDGTDGPLAPGDRLGRLTVLSVAGVGGMGVVYVAHDPALDRKVAVKFITHQGGAQMRLLREAQAMARLTHPNTSSVFDVGTHDGHVYLAMEYVEGGNLRQWLDAVARNWSDSLELMVQAGRGLAAAHRAGIVHRDLKPDNILVADDGRVLVTDFGIACSGPNSGTEPHEQRTKPIDYESALSTPLTNEGAVLGTPAYMAPEQHEGGEVDPRSDQFAFCVTLHEAVYGERPFRGRASEVSRAILTGNITHPDDQRHVPQWLRRIILRGLSRNPAERFPSMDALLSALTWRGRRRWPIAVFAAVVVVAAGAAAAMLLTRGGPEPSSPGVCRGAETKLEGVWDPIVKQAIEASFLATELPFAADTWQRVETRLDGYSAQWVRAHTDACEATQVRAEQSGEMLDKRMLCLERRRKQLQSLTQLFSNADNGVLTKAAENVHSLPAISDCSDLEALSMGVEPPADPEVVEAVDRIRATNAALRQLANAGQIDEALAMAEESVAAANATGYLPIKAETLFSAGFVLHTAGKLEEADEMLEEAAWAAESSSHDEIAAEAWSLLAYAAANADKFEEAGKRGRRADAAVRRLGSPPRLLGHLHQALGTLAFRQGNYDESLTHYRAAVDNWQQAFRPDNPIIGKAFNNLAIALAKLGDFAGSMQAHERALAVKRNALGELHPSVGYTLNNIGEVYRERGMYSKALHYYQRSIEVWDAAMGPGSPGSGFSHNNVGEVLRAEGRYADAIVAYQRAFDIWTQLGPDHRYLAWPLAGIGSCRLALGQLGDATTYLERAIAVRPSGGDPIELGDTRFALAEALWPDRAQRKRATTLADEARAAYVAAGERGRDELASLDVWRAAHR